MDGTSSSLLKKLSLCNVSEFACSQTFVMFFLKSGVVGSHFLTVSVGFPWFRNRPPQACAGRCSHSSPVPGNARGTFIPCVSNCFYTFEPWHSNSLASNGFQWSPMANGVGWVSNGFQFTLRPVVRSGSGCFGLRRKGRQGRSGLSGVAERAGCLLLSSPVSGNSRS